MFDALWGWKLDCNATTNAKGSLHSLAKCIYISAWLYQEDPGQLSNIGVGTHSNISFFFKGSVMSRCLLLPLQVRLDPVDATATRILNR